MITVVTLSYLLLGHVGLVPPKRTWTGGFVAVGKTSNDAMMVYDNCLKIQDAGGVAIEMECVPYKVAEAISKKVKRIVFCSSMARYGSQKTPFNEEMTPKPIDPYGISKVASEDILKNLRL